MPKTTLLATRGAQTRYDVTWNFAPIIFFSSLRIFYAKMANFEGGRGLHILSCDRASINSIFKAGNQNEVKNCRTVSILPLLNKVMEKCICIRLYNFITDFDIISPRQWWFQKGKSTDEAYGNCTFCLVSPIIKWLNSKLTNWFSILQLLSENKTCII